MIILVALLSILFFLIVFWWLEITKIGTDSIKTVQSAVATLNDKSLNDKVREKTIQEASIKLFTAFISILFRSAMALVISFLPIFLANFAGLVTTNAVVSFLSQWDVIVIITIIITGWYFLSKRSKPYRIDTFNVNYSKLDRLLHRVAFSTPAVQLTASDIEKATFGKIYNGIKPDAPIFITSLARAGTTLLLEVLHRHPVLATHNYRDMPFVMAPMLWSRLSKSFKKDNTPVERAHGDGIQVGFDSPEAFEEILWYTFYAEKYTKFGIRLWSGDDEKESVRLFFIEHMKKIIALRRPGLTAGGRYLSKNNGNISRIDFILKMFPGASVIIPLRQPIAHSASLWRQHLKFLKMQESDPFIKRYMSDIGHFDFGARHLPVLFPMAEKLIRLYDPTTLDYWIAYWIATFSYVFERKDKVILLSYENTCLNGKKTLIGLCKRLGIPQDGIPDIAASIYKAPSKKHINSSGFDSHLLKKADKLYENIVKYAT